MPIHQTQCRLYVYSGVSIPSPSYHNHRPTNQSPAWKFRHIGFKESTWINPDLVVFPKEGPAKQQHTNLAYLFMTKKPLNNLSSSRHPPIWRNLLYWLPQNEWDWYFIYYQNLSFYSNKIITIYFSSKMKLIKVPKSRNSDVLLPNAKG